MPDVITDQATQARRLTPADARFTSILFPDGRPLEMIEKAPEPDFFGDLNLDQVFAAVCAAKEEYRLDPFFRLPLDDITAVNWRQAIVRDLQRADIRSAIELFAASQREMRHALEQREKAYHALEKQRWFLDAVLSYCGGVACLRSDLAAAKPASDGFAALLDYLAESTSADRFERLIERARAVAAGLASIRYCLVVDGPRVEVRRACSEADYGSAIEQLFADFASSEVEEHFDFPFTAGMSQVEEKVLQLVAKLHGEAFAKLERFAADVHEFADPLIVRFDREVQFYIAFLDERARIGDGELPDCMPIVQTKSHEVEITSGYDLALAIKLFDESAIPVANDLRLRGPERILIVSGPNQGGKTTFARMFGQIHYLAALGLPVPAARARVQLFDRLFTHFEREESLAGPGGKLKDDIVRVHAILEQATDRSLIIFNEIFTSTTVEDASRLSRATADRIREAGSVCLWVTFLDDLASLGADFVSMVAEIPADDPVQRTYKIVRRPPDGVAHALAIAERYGLSCEQVLQRVRQ